MHNSNFMYSVSFSPHLTQMASSRHDWHNPDQCHPISTRQYRHCAAPL